MSTSNNFKPGILTLMLLAVTFVKCYAQELMTEWFVDNYSNLTLSANVNYTSNSEIISVISTARSAIIADYPQKIFDKNLAKGIRIESAESAQSESKGTDIKYATELNITPKVSGELTIFYVRSAEGNEINDTKDIRINPETSEIPGTVKKSIVTPSLIYGIKTFSLAQGATYMMTATKGCILYGYIFSEKSLEKYTKWDRSSWDFSEFSKGEGITSPSTVYYDGLILYGGTNETSVTTYGYYNAEESSDCERYISFTPTKDGIVTVYYQKRGSVDPMAVIGKNIVIEYDKDKLLANADIVAVNCTTQNVSEISTALCANRTYSIYFLNDAFSVTKVEFIDIPEPEAATKGDNTVTLTTTANMQGWRSFYDESQGYVADAYTTVYVASSVSGKTVTLQSLNDRKVPKACPVILRTNRQLTDGKYEMTLTKDEVEDYNGTNYLMASASGQTISAYRLGYKAGEDKGVGFYRWNANEASAGIVYLPLNETSESQATNAKLSFAFDCISTDICSEPSIHYIEHTCTRSYNFLGQQVTPNAKGLIIRNGKKMFIK